MNEIDRFFRPINSVMEIPDSDYAKTRVCIAMANALARNTEFVLPWPMPWPAIRTTVCTS